MKALIVHLSDGSHFVADIVEMEFDTKMWASTKQREFHLLSVTRIEEKEMV